MSKAQEIIEDAFIEIGVLVAGGSLGTADLAWGKRKFNRFLQTLSLNALNINFLTKENFSLISGTNSYTIGTSGDFDTARPNSFDVAYIKENEHDYEVRVRPIHEYWEISDKTISNRPTAMYFDRQVPLGIIYFDYVPIANHDFHFTSSKPFTVYDDVSAENVVVPKEHEEMFVTNMAVRYASRYGKPISRDLKETAEETLQDIQGSNLAKTLEGIDMNITGVGYRYDVDGDTYK
jgi:hypothetical protein